MNEDNATDLRPAIRDFLRSSGIAPHPESARLTALNGGVSSEVWRIELPDGDVCVKVALGQLKVDAPSFAPVSRSRAEVDWLRFAHSVEPGRAPRVLASDEEAGFFAMEFLPSEDHSVWKDLMLAGEVDVATARAVGDLLGSLHSASAADPATRAGYNDDATFEAVRILRYLHAPGVVHPDLAERLEILADRTRSIKAVLTHGDVTPKNILVGPNGPVLLDAEWAWFGEPAFDVAFCLNHLMLSAFAVPDVAAELYESASALMAGYLPHVSWEDASALDERVATLVPAMALALVDGDSPVGYLDASDHVVVRRVARALLLQPPLDLADLVRRWQDEVVSIA